MSPPGAAPDMTMFDRTVTAIRAGELLPAEAKANPQTAMLASMPEEGLAYIHSADRVDPVTELAKVKVPVLIVQGGRDDSVPASHADMLRAARASLPTNVAAFPNLTHFYKAASPGLLPMQAIALRRRAIRPWRMRSRLGRVIWPGRSFDRSITDFLQTRLAFLLGLPDVKSLREAAGIQPPALPLLSK